jgi:hypothetical protein
MQFTTRKDAFKKIKSQALIRVAPLMFVALAVGIIMSWPNSKQKSDPAVILFTIPVMAVAATIGLSRGLNRQKKLFESYTLRIFDNMIVREQLNTPKVSIFFNDISEITKNNKGAFVIKGKHSTDLIIIPFQMEDYQDLEAALNKIRPVTNQVNKTFLQRFGALIPLPVIGLMIVVYAATNKILVAICGSLLLGIMLWCIYEIRRSKNIDLKTKKAGWWLLFVLLSIVGMMIVKLTRTSE